MYFYTIKQLNEQRSSIKSAKIFMYSLKNIQSGQVITIQSVFDVMAYLNDANYDRVKTQTKPEVIYNTMTNYDLDVYAKLIALKRGDATFTWRGSKKIDIRFTNEQ